MTNPKSLAFKHGNPNVFYGNFSSREVDMQFPDKKTNWDKVAMS